MHKKELSDYGLKQIARVFIEGNNFRINVTDDDAVELRGCIYAFAIDEEIVRVGSSSGRLTKRLSAWQRDVSRALAGEKSSTPLSEAERWRMALAPGTNGVVYARQATIVTTPVGAFTTHLDEERVLIARHRPRLNRSSR